MAPGALARISFDPQDAILEIGAAQQYAVRAFDEFNNDITGLTLSWEVASGAGTIDSNSLLIVGTTAGMFPITVLAVEGSVMIRAEGSITVNPGPLSSVVLSPTELTLPMKATE